MGGARLQERWSPRRRRSFNTFMIIWPFSPCLPPPPRGTHLAFLQGCHHLSHRERGRGHRARGGSGGESRRRRRRRLKGRRGSDGPREGRDSDDGGARRGSAGGSSDGRGGGNGAVGGVAAGAGSKGGDAQGGGGSRGESGKVQMLKSAIFCHKQGVGLLFSTGGRRTLRSTSHGGWLA